MVCLWVKGYDKILVKGKMRLLLVARMVDLYHRYMFDCLFASQLFLAFWDLANAATLENS